MNRICTICVRAGSKGVKNKNVRMLEGKYLFLHSLDQAISLNIFDAIAVSTDCDKIKEVLKTKYPSVHVINRPLHMAADTSPKLDVIQHCVKKTEKITGVKYRVSVDLDATSPLRFPSDIKACISLLESTKAPNVITGTVSRRSPYFNLVEQLEDGSVSISKTISKSITRRQDVPRSFDMNASIYVWWRESLMDSNTLFHKGTLLYEMPEDRSVDIDSELDFKIVEMIMKMREKK